MDVSVVTYAVAVRARDLEDVVSSRAEGIDAEVVVLFQGILY